MKKTKGEDDSDAIGELSVRESFELIARFRLQVGYPKDDIEALTLLAADLRRVSKSAAHARAIVEHVREQNLFCPSIQELRLTAKQVPDPNQGKGKPS